MTTSVHRSVRILDLPIQTIYDHPGSVSHFSPLIGSMKIYFVLLRFGLVSFLTAVLDNTVFFLTLRASATIEIAQIIARTVALLFTYTAARSAVFLSREKHRAIFPKYFALVPINGLVSYFLIEALASQFGLRGMSAKTWAETF